MQKSQTLSQFKKLKAIINTYFKQQFNFIILIIVLDFNSVGFQSMSFDQNCYKFCYFYGYRGGPPYILHFFN